MSADEKLPKPETIDNLFRTVSVLIDRAVLANAKIEVLEGRIERLERDLGARLQKR